MQVLPAIAVAPPTGTCRAATTGNLSTIDDWLTSPDFAKVYMAPRVMDEWTPRPRYPVRLDLAARPRVHLQLHLRAPKPFPRQQPRFAGASPLPGPPPPKPHIE
eukprot:7976799-Pyramimonas_sp.AAC.1